MASALVQQKTWKNTERARSSTELEAGTFQRAWDLTVTSIPLQIPWKISLFSIGPQSSTSKSCLLTSAVTLNSSKIINRVIHRTAEKLRKSLQLTGPSRNSLKKRSDLRVSCPIRGFPTSHPSPREVWRVLAALRRSVGHSYERHGFIVIGDNRFPFSF